MGVDNINLSNNLEALSNTNIGDVDIEGAKKAIHDLLVALGEDPNSPNLVETPRRVANMYSELLVGRNKNPEEFLETTFDIGHDEIVMVKNIGFASLCEHHLIPFVGIAHVAYIPNNSGKITGLSKLARVVEGYARRLQVQERMTTQIADAMEASLEPKGVLVVVEAEHYCMSIRGVKKQNTKTVTSSVRGIFRDDWSTRNEAINLLLKP